MIPASPGFQPDRPGSPGFQLADHGGFQTQTPAQVGDLGVRVGLSSPAQRGVYLPSHELVGELQIAVALASPARFGSRTPPAWPSSGVLLRPGHPAYTGEIGVVVGLASPSRFSTAIERGMIERDDELLILAHTHAHHDAWLIALIEEDDAIVTELRRRRVE